MLEQSWHAVYCIEVIFWCPPISIASMMQQHWNPHPNHWSAIMTIVTVYQVVFNPIYKRPLQASCTDFCTSKNIHRWIFLGKSFMEVSLIKSWMERTFMNSLKATRRYAEFSSKCEVHEKTNVFNTRKYKSHLEIYEYYLHLMTFRKSIRLWFHTCKSFCAPPWTRAIAVVLIFFKIKSGNFNSKVSKFLFANVHTLWKCPWVYP